MTRILSWVTGALWLIATEHAGAVTGVNPTGVNVNARGTTSVFITFQNLGNQEASSESFWCGELISAGLPIVTNFNPCRSDTILGFLPPRNDLSQPSGTSRVRNLTDIMTIPSSVARRAFQSGQRGEDATFFYVRRFIDTSTGSPQETFVRVTCRMAGGGARVPLAITRVDIGFVDTERSVYFFLDSEPLPEFGAKVSYNGSGRLKGRWEVMMPGDEEPTEFDLLPEASLPVEQRVLQKRYTLLGRFDVFLPPTGTTFIKGPDPTKVPRNANGAFKILLRIEATNDREGNSNTLDGIVSSGGVSGFAIPPLRYYLASASEAKAKRGLGPDGNRLELLAPRQDATIDRGQQPDFSWTDVPGADLYLLQIRDQQQEKYSAYVKSGTARYTLPPWLRESTEAESRLLWRVLALSKTGAPLVESDWRPFKFSD